MTVLTRSKTSHIRYEAQRLSAYAHISSLFKKNLAAELTKHKCAIAIDIIVFILDNHHMNELLKTNIPFRHTALRKCEDFLTSSDCPRALAYQCRLLKQTIHLLNGALPK